METPAAAQEEREMKKFLFLESFLLFTAPAKKFR